MDGWILITHFIEDIMDAGILLDTALQHCTHRKVFTQINKYIVMTTSVPACYKMWPL